MKRKSIKIAISLLVAISFLIPTGAVMAGNGDNEAGVNETTEDYTIRRMIDDVISQGPEDVTVDQILLVPKDSSGNDIGDPFILADGDKIPMADCYGIILQLTNPTGVEECVIPMADIYTLDEGKEVVMYETSFEDNFDIYNNWIQIDGDCSLAGGYYDSFSWSDARASDGDHSMKSTMYDIYKGRQNDYLQCTQTFDMTDQYAFNVSFDIWVEGEGDYAGGAYYQHIIYDYLSFEYSTGYYAPPFDWNNPDWLAMGDAMFDPRVDQMFFSRSGNEGLGGTTGSYMFFDTAMPLSYVGQYAPYADYTVKVNDLGGGWWHVWYQMPVSYMEWFWGVPMDQMQFRFDWHTDTQFQYEGAYVDNFKVISIESEQQKVFQAAAQEEICIPAGETIFVEVTDHDGVQLNWCNFDFGDYRAYGYTCANTTKVPIDFEVVDNVDCAITDLEIEDSNNPGTIIPDGGEMTFGQDAHIMFCLTNNGNIPIENVPVTATAKKLVWEEELFSDFEGLPWSDVGSFGGVNLWHKTDFDAWSGSNSFGFFDKDTMHYENDIDTAYAYSPKAISVEDVEEMYLDYYYKAILADDQDSFNFIFQLLTGNYIFTCNYGPYYDGPIYQPTWVGPNQPQGIYGTHGADLIALYDYFHGARGLGYNADGTPSYDITIGVAFTAGPAGYTNHQAEMNGDYWSGVLIDDVQVVKKAAGDTVWTDTVIIPGPIEPGETICSPPQFEWEDVPYSAYIIEVCTGCEDDVEPDNNCKDQTIVVMDDLELATDKLVTSADLTCEGEGEWGISSSDIDNHFCSNPTTQTYPSDANFILRLAPTEGVYDGETVDVSDDFPCLIDISHLDLADTPVTYLNEGFDSGLTPSGWNEWPAGEWTYPNQNLAGGTAPEARIRDNEMTGTSAYIDTISVDTSGADELYLSFTSRIVAKAGATTNFNCKVHVWDGSAWNLIQTWDTSSDVPAASYNFNIHGLKSTDTKVRFRINDNDGSNFQNWRIDDVKISGLTYAPDDLHLEFEAWYDLEAGYDYCVLEVADVNNSEGCDPDTGEGIADQWTDWTMVDFYDGWSNGWIDLDYDLEDYFDYSSGFMALRFRIVSDGGVEFRGFRFDDFTINGLFDISTLTEPNKYADLIDTGDDMANWRNEQLCMGTNWEAVSDTCFSAVDDTGEPGWEAGVSFNDALTWSTEIEDAYEAYLTADVNVEDSLGYWFAPETNAGGEYVWQSGVYNIGGDHLVVLDMEFTDAVNEVRIVSYDGTTEIDQHSWHDTDSVYFEFSPKVISPYNYIYVEVSNWSAMDPGQINMSLGLTSQLFLEFSADGGENWLSLDEWIFDGTYKTHNSPYDLTPWAGNPVLVRFRYVGDMGGDVEICDIAIKGKKDTTAPSSTITMSGTMADAGWYSTPVQCTITATDDNAVKEIHYILDGSETVVAGDSASFTVSGNGAHNLEFWAVDMVGNVESPRNTVPTFRIDSGSPPTVAITAPEPGLYLFGNKLLSLSKVMIIGAFTAEATASDADSGVYRVQFLLDGDVVAEDTEAPFSAYIAEKHMGAGTLSVVAEDFAGNTADDELEITYYKFL